LPGRIYSSDENITQLILKDTAPRPIIFNFVYQIQYKEKNIIGLQG